MKFKTLLFLSLVMTAGFLQAETLYIAKITDMLGNVGYKIMNREEYSAATKEVAEERKIFTKVVAECKKEWKADEERKVSFQSSKVKLRKISKGGAMYSKMEKAEAKLSKLEDSVTEKHMEKLDEHSKKWKRMDERTMEKEKGKLGAWKQSFEMTTKKMEAKLGRPVPHFGFDLIAPEPRK